MATSLFWWHIDLLNTAGTAGVDLPNLCYRADIGKVGLFRARRVRLARDIGKQGDSRPDAGFLVTSFRREEPATG